MQRPYVKQTSLTRAAMACGLALAMVGKVSAASDALAIPDGTPSPTDWLGGDSKSESTKGEQSSENSTIRPSASPFLAAVISVDFEAAGIAGEPQELPAVEGAGPAGDTGPAESTPGDVIEGEPNEEEPSQSPGLPRNLDRGDLLRLSLAGDLRASGLLLAHPELMMSRRDAIRAARVRAAEGGLWRPRPAEQEARRQLYERLLVQAPLASEVESLDLLGYLAQDVPTGWLDHTQQFGVLLSIEQLHQNERVGRLARLGRAELIVEHSRGITPA